MTPQEIESLKQNREKFAGLLTTLEAAQREKNAFQAMPPMPQPGADPMAGGMPPGGGAPPMDPAMMGGAPPAGGMPPGGAPPMDPAMMGGAPPEAGGGDPMAQMAEILPQIVEGLQALSDRMDGIDQTQQQIVAGLSEGNDPAPPM